MSLGGSGSSITLGNAVDSAWSAGLIVVAAAGNSGGAGLSYPAAYPHCISVAAVDSSGTLAGFSNYGSSVDIAAPGVSIASTYKGSGYALMSGTSMATPHVAGVAALIWAYAPGASNQKVRNRLQGSATISVTTPDGSALKVVDAYAGVTSTSP
jgi:subtilisin family serine protease